MTNLIWLPVILASVVLIVWGAETFAEHLGAAAVRLRVSVFALSLLLAGAEPEELATAVAASLKDAPGLALGDVIGANVAICLVALGVGALVKPLPFSDRVLRYAIFGVPLGAIATGFVWNGTVGRREGLVLVSLYILYVAGIWILERQPPTLGETGELKEAKDALEVEQLQGLQHWVGRDLMLVLAGLGAMAGGATLLVEAVHRISNTEKTQTILGLTLVGFATAFELVVLAWSAARRGASEAVMASVVGSFAYNVTMTLGMAAIARPLIVLDATRLHLPLWEMQASLVLVLLFAIPKNKLTQTAGAILLVLYPLFLITALRT